MNIEKKEILEFEILKHVEETPILNNRMAAAKLGCSVKLAHELLSKMTGKGLLNIKKRHSRRWDYFLTPKGITEKARLTYEFLDFSMQFYREARKRSSQLCKDLADSGNHNIAFIGAGDLAEIVYLGIKEWNLKLAEVFDNDIDSFIGLNVKPLNDIFNSNADAIITCLYNKSHPMQNKNYLPDEIKQTLTNNKSKLSTKLHWIF